MTPTVTVQDGTTMEAFTPLYVDCLLIISNIIITKAVRLHEGDEMGHEEFQGMYDMYCESIYPEVCPSRTGSGPLLNGPQGEEEQR